MASAQNMNRIGSDATRAEKAVLLSGLITCVQCMLEVLAAAITKNMDNNNSCLIF